MNNVFDDHALFVFRSVIGSPRAMVRNPDKRYDSKNQPQTGFQKLSSGYALNTLSAKTFLNISPARLYSWNSNRLWWQHSTNRHLRMLVVSVQVTDLATVTVAITILAKVDLEWLPASSWLIKETETLNSGRMKDLTSVANPANACQLCSCPGHQLRIASLTRLIPIISCIKLTPENFELNLWTKKSRNLETKNILSKYKLDKPSHDMDGNQNPQT